MSDKKVNINISEIDIGRKTTLAYVNTHGVADNELWIVSKYNISGYLSLSMSRTNDVPDYYTDDVPKNLIPPERALRSVNLISEEFEEREGAADLVSFSVESYSGKKVKEKALIRSVHTTTKERCLSEAAESAGAVDEGPPTGFENTEYSGIVEQEKIDCPTCGGFGRTCLKCDGDRTISCPECFMGEIEYDCGCATTEYNSGARHKSVRAETGKVLRTCTGCGGDGRQEYFDGSSVCKKCDGQGAFIETCQNCGGNGISRKEQCARCDGTGRVTCPKCNGTGNADDCPRCEAAGEMIREEHRQVQYNLIERNLIGGSDILKDNVDQVSFRRTDSSLVESEFDSVLDHIPEQSGSEIVRAKRVEYEPIAYEAELYNAEIDVLRESADDESLKMLVSTDGLVDWKGSHNDRINNENNRGSIQNSTGRTKINKDGSPSSQPSTVDKLRSINASKVLQLIVVFGIGVVGGEILATDILGLSQDALLTWVFSLIIPAGITYALVSQT